MAKIVYKNYDKMTDTCMYLDKDLVLKFNVELHRAGPDHNRSYHREYGYNLNGSYRIKISREFEYYLSLEGVNRPKDGERKTIIKIYETDMYFFKYALDNVLVWFTNDEYKSLFVHNEDKITMTINDVKPIRCILKFNNYLEFVPTVVRGYNEDLIGVRVFLNSDGTSAFLRINTFLALHNFIMGFNMFQSAQIMLNYLQRPEFGTNYIDIESGYSTIDECDYNPTPYTSRNRDNDKRGFFDRIRDRKNNRS